MHPDQVKQAYSCTPFSEVPGPSVHHASRVEHLHKVKTIESRMKEELVTLKARQDIVTLHHKVLKEINLVVEADGSLDSEKFATVIGNIRNDLDVKMAKQLEALQEKLETNPSIQDQIDALPEKYKASYDFLDDSLKSSDDIRKGNKLITKEQKDRLVDNIRMDMEDLNTQNDMQLQKVSRITQETHECHQQLRIMEKNEDESFKKNIDKWGNR